MFWKADYMKRKFLVLCYAAAIIAYLAVAFALNCAKVYSGYPKEVLSSTSVPLYGADADSAYIQTSAQSAVLIDAKTGAVLYEKNSSARLPMASTTKIMTAKIVLDKLPLDSVIKVPKEATLVEGSSIYLQENEEITVEILLYGLLLESGNDAAHTLAVACSGSIEDFAVLMNETGKAMGLTDTNFANPHGLTAENHYTSAYELAYITAEAMKNEKFREIVSTKKYLAPSMDGKLTRLFLNHNKMLKFYDGAAGVKTGFTKAAGRCLVSAAQRDGRTFIAVTLNDGNDWNDHICMLDYAFENFDTVEIADEDSFGVYSGGTRLSNDNGVWLTVSKGQNPELSYEVEFESGVKGTVRYFADGKELGKFYIS